MAIFDKNKTLEAPKKSKKSDRLEVAIKGIEAVAAIDAVIKSLTAIKETKAAEVKKTMTETFLRLGTEKKIRPDNFRGIEGNASASCELRARSSRSTLSEAEIELATKYGIKTEEVSSTTETYVINPKYLSDAAVMKAVEAALSKVKGLPEDFIQFQEATKATIIADGAIEEMFATKTAKECADILPIVSTLAIKPTMNDEDMTTALEVVKKLVGVDLK